MKPNKRYFFKITLLPTLAYLCLLPPLLTLGTWQWHRAEQKRELLQTQAQRLTNAPLTLSKVKDNALETLRYQPMQMEGYFDSEHSFLLDNQISAGKAGYFVLTPFITQNNDAVLINRGWIALTGKRADLPLVPVDKNQRVITGRLNAFPSVGVIIAGADIPSDGFPSLVQVINTAQIIKKLGYKVRAFQIELSTDMPDGFKREWQTTTLMLPEQHIAYALQWFGLAITLTILFIWHSFKKTTET